MSLNESIPGDAALERLGELGYAAGYGPHLAPREQAAERDSFGEAVPVGCLCEVSRQLTPDIPSRTLAALRDTLLPKLLNAGLNVATAKEAANAW